MLRGWSTAILFLLLIPTQAFAQGRRVRLRVPEGYHDHESLDKRMESLIKARPKILSRQVIGKSRTGRPIYALLLSGRDVNVNHKPAMLVIGNMAGNEAAGGEAVLRIAEFVVVALDKEPAFKALMVKRAIWLIPRPNPDATELLFRVPVQVQRTTVTATDDDRDGDSDEDGPTDLNGDGWILPMRVPDSNGSLIFDKANQTLLRKAETRKGEQGRFRVILEGRDTDKDGKINEDGLGGTDLDRNFPIHWRAADKVQGAGPRPLSEPESKALADFLLAHRNISLVVHLHSNHHGALSAGKDPVPKSDRALYDALQKLYQDSGKSKTKPLDAFAIPDNKASSGTFQDFSYHGLGLMTWPARIWMQPPTVITKDEDKKVSASLRRQRQWLRFFKKRGSGYLDWKPLRHPTLGPVHIGGFTPFSLKTPPSDLLAAAVAPVLRFVLNGATLLPEIELIGQKVKKLASDVFELTFEIRNRGFLPTQTKRAVQVKRNSPTILLVNLGDGDRIIMGQSRMLLPDLNGGQSIKRSLIISSGGKGPVTLVIRSPKGGRTSLKVNLGKGV
jgi:hypothetical protein